ncbi:hypothetical protein NC651_018775 [Populus alba x Populus x berolinensis]|nr:hypothetical protein NC651_018775 [Populus alba x Populus x berolinensis]
MEIELVNKKLTTTAIKSCLAYTTGNLWAFQMVQGQNAINFNARDPTGRVWEFKQIKIDTTLTSICLNFQQIIYALHCKMEPGIVHIDPFALPSNFQTKRLQRRLQCQPPSSIIYITKAERILFSSIILLPSS